MATLNLNSILALVMIISMSSVFINVDGMAPSGWFEATATYYGGSDASGTMAGACGYGNTYNAGYGTSITALSTPLFQGGASCGNCYRIVCNYRKDPTWCLLNKGITVTATDLCPYGSFGGWCDPGKYHFDMSQPAWSHIGILLGGAVPVLYQRVPCHRHGGMRFTINGNQWFNLVLISNVNQAGSISAISIKGSNTDWVPMSCNWGVNWQSSTVVVGQSLSFRVTSTSGAVVTCNNIADSYWAFGQTFSAKYCNFAN